MSDFKAKYTKFNFCRGEGGTGKGGIGRGRKGREARGGPEEGASYNDFLATPMFATSLIN